MQLLSLFHHSSFYLDAASLTFHRQITFFEKLGYHVLAPNLRGYNLSSTPSSLFGLTVSELSSDILSLVQLYAPTVSKRAIIVGHDWGGLIGATFCSLYPQHCEKLVLLNIGHPNAYIKVYNEEAEAKKMATYAFIFSVPIIPPLLVSR